MITRYASGFELVLVTMQLSAIVSVLHRAGIVSADDIVEHVHEQAVAMAVDLEGSDQLKQKLGEALGVLEALRASLGEFEPRLPPEAQ